MKIKFFFYKLLIIMLLSTLNHAEVKESIISQTFSASKVAGPEHSEIAQYLAKQFGNDYPHLKKVLTNEYLDRFTSALGVNNKFRTHLKTIPKNTWCILHLRSTDNKIPHSNPPMFNIELVLTLLLVEDSKKHLTNITLNNFWTLKESTKNKRYKIEMVFNQDIQPRRKRIESSDSGDRHVRTRERETPPISYRDTPERKTTSFTPTDTEGDSPLIEEEESEERSLSIKARNNERRELLNDFALHTATTLSMVTGMSEDTQNINDLLARDIDRGIENKKDLQESFESKAEKFNKRIKENQTILTRSMLLLRTNQSRLENILKRIDKNNISEEEEAWQKQVEESHKEITSAIGQCVDGSETVSTFFSNLFVLLESLIGLQNEPKYMKLNSELKKTQGIVIRQQSQYMRRPEGATSSRRPVHNTFDEEDGEKDSEARAPAAHLSTRTPAYSQVNKKRVQNENYESSQSRFPESRETKRREQSPHQDYRDNKSSMVGYPQEGDFQERDQFPPQDYEEIISGMLGSPSFSGYPQQGSYPMPKHENYQGRLQSPHQQYGENTPSFLGYTSQQDNYQMPPYRGPRGKSDSPPQNYGGNESQLSESPQFQNRGYGNSHAQSYGTETSIPPYPHDTYRAVPLSMPPPYNNGRPNYEIDSDSQYPSSREASNYDKSSKYGEGTQSNASDFGQRSPMIRVTQNEVPSYEGRGQSQMDSGTGFQSLGQLPSTIEKDTSSSQRQFHSQLDLKVTSMGINPSNIQQKGGSSSSDLNRDESNRGRGHYKKTQDTKYRLETHKKPEIREGAQDGIKKTIEEMYKKSGETDQKRVLEIQRKREKVMKDIRQGKKLQDIAKFKTPAVANVASSLYNLSP